MSAAKRTTRTKRAAKPRTPARWNADIRGLSVAWYYVSDWGRAKKFYGETLGLPIAFAAEEAGWIEYGLPKQPTLGISRWTGPNPMPPTKGGGTATLACDDARGAIQRLRAKGVRCDEVEEIPGMVILGTFYDPEGNQLQLAQSLTPGS